MLSVNYSSKYFHLIIFFFVVGMLVDTDVWLQEHIVDMDPTRLEGERQFTWTLISIQDTMTEHMEGTTIAILTDMIIITDTIDPIMDTPIPRHQKTPQLLITILNPRRKKIPSKLNYVPNKLNNVFFVTVQW